MSLTRTFSLTATVAVALTAVVVPLSPADAAPVYVSTAPSQARVDQPAPVQLLPLTTASGEATELAQAEPSAEMAPAVRDSGTGIAGTSSGSAIRPSFEAAVSALTDVDPERAATLLTEPMEVDDFVVAGFTWQGAQDLPTGTRIYLRLRQHGQWSPWYLSEAAQDGPDDGRGVPGTEEIITGGADGVQAAVLTSAALPKDLTLALVPSQPQGETTLSVDEVSQTDAPATSVEADTAPAVSVTEMRTQPNSVVTPGAAGAAVSDEPETADADAMERNSTAAAVTPPASLQVPQAAATQTPAGTVGGTAMTPVAGLFAATTTANGLPVPVYTRAEWGAGGHGSWNLEYATAGHVIVHHTAGSNDYTKDQSAGIVKGIYHYHATTLGWGDIGYNFLVDKYGQVFEGRDGTLASAPGKMVVAGHAYGVNTGSMGISMMGNYSTVAPSQAQLDSVGKIAGWFLRRGGHTKVTENAGLKIHATARYKAGQTISLPRILGHRDVGYTECPGNVGYTYLGKIREIANADRTPEPIEARMTWIVRNNDIAVGAAPSDGRYNYYEYRWMSYRVDSGEWSTISDWSTGNWSSWAQDQGTYWLHLEVRDPVTKKVVGQNTVAFAHSPGRHRITGTYAAGQPDGSVLLGLNSSNPEARYVTMIYDVQRKTWVAQFAGQWATWRPKPGIYWTHFVVYTPDGKLQDARTYAFGVAGTWKDSFDAGNIIPDSEFFGAGKMSADQVRAFLKKQNPTCRPGADGAACLQDYRTSTKEMDTAYCRPYAASSSEDAASIITKTAAACGVSEKALLVLLQKEQGLITASGATLSQNRYAKATGFRCPDSAPCDPTYSGLASQLYYAASRLVEYGERSYAFNFRAGQTAQIAYHPEKDRCGAGPVMIANRATAALYNYTPYQPNKAALANMSGSGDTCSSYGNRNFWKYYTSWFE